MRFTDVHVRKSERFSIGIEEESGRNYLSIPVSNALVDYEEYYFIDKSMADNFPDNLNDVLEFVEKCRNRENDEFLIQQPGADRGISS